MKAICIIRTSTDRQRIEEQRKEVLQMAYADGYEDNDIEVIGKCGASAIKLDDAYMENLNALYKRIESGDVAVVYAWAIDRIGRNEEVLMRLKNTLIRHKVQLIIKNPSLTLLNSDGSVNSGVEIAFSLFATMAKQEMEQKKERFKRGKKQSAEAGKFNGGTIPYGYDVDERGFFTIHPTDGANVLLAFELMATDTYTVAQVTTELRARGVQYNGRLITYQFVASMLKNTAYKGMRNKYGFNKKYPRIVSDELWAKAQSVKALNNSTKGKAKKHHHLAALLIKCPVCGRSYVGHGEKYVCSGYNAPSIRTVMGQPKCTNNILIRQKHLDGALWSITKKLHTEINVRDKEEIKRTTISQLEVLRQKVGASKKREEEFAERYERIDEIYAKGRRTKEWYNKQIADLEEEESNLKNEIASYVEEYRWHEHVLFTLEEPEAEIEDIGNADNDRRYELVHRYIKGVALARATLNNRKGVEIAITDHRGRAQYLYYIPNLKGTDRKVFTKDGDGELVPFEYEPILKQ